MSGILDKIANISVIIGVTVFLGIVARNEFFPPKMPPNPAIETRKALIGKMLHPQGIEFPRQHGVVLLAISSSCHFCEENLPFYKELVGKSRGKLEVFALLPQPQQAAESYMKEAGVTVARIVSTDLQALGIRSTPTLILLDQNGKVRDAWVGYLDEARQKRVLSQVLAN